MNILMITGDRALASGKKAAFFNTIDELRKHFNRIDIICPRITDSSQSANNLFENVFIHPSPWPIVFQWAWIYFEGKRIIKENNTEVMTIHEYAPIFNGVGARLLHQKTNIPYIIEIHHIVGHPKPSNIKESIYCLISKLIFPITIKHSSAVRVVNKTETPNWLKKIGIPESKIIIVPSIYIDTNVFCQHSNIEKKYDIAFVGRLVVNKGLPLFLDVAKITGMSCIIVGDGPLYQQIADEAKQRKLNIVFTGFVPSVVPYINESKLLLMTSYNEGGPRVILEALACGVPVVATRVGIVSDILPPECIADWDEVDISEKAKNILNDPVLYERLKENGLSVSTQFERSKAVSKYAEFIKQTAND